MGTHSWTNRVFPPLVLAAIAGSIWYAVTHRSDFITSSAVASSVPDMPKLSPKQPVVQAATLPVPTVKKISGHVQLSVDTQQVKNVQKVEFYVGKQLVGAAFSSPYSVTFDENNLQSGTHQVTAKVYTPDTTTQTGPTSFTSQQTMSATDKTPAAGDTNTPLTPPTSSQPPATPTVAPDTPTNVTAVLESDGTVLASWDASNGTDPAVSYQVWQGTLQIGTSATTTYTDSTVTPGGTYDYQIIAVDAANNTSPASDTAAVSVPAATNSQPTSTAGSQNNVPPDTTAPTSSNP